MEKLRRSMTGIECMSAMICDFWYVRWSLLVSDCTWGSFESAVKGLWAQIHHLHPPRQTQMKPCNTRFLWAENSTDCDNFARSDPEERQLTHTCSGVVLCRFQRVPVRTEIFAVLQFQDLDSDLKNQKIKNKKLYSTAHHYKCWSRPCTCTVHARTRFLSACMYVTALAQTGQRHGSADPV